MRLIMGCQGILRFESGEDPKCMDAFAHAAAQRKLLRSAASLLGSISTPKKAAASRLNGLKGGRKAISALLAGAIREAEGAR